jgi:hypothetical protein
VTASFQGRILRDANFTALSFYCNDIGDMGGTLFFAILLFGRRKKKGTIKEEEKKKKE